MNYPTHDTDWPQNSKGHFWRRYQRNFLLVGSKDGKTYWVSINGTFLNEKFQAIYEAQDTADAKVGANDGRFWWR